MPRIARMNLETSFFHIIVQGLNKENIFNNEEYMKKYLYLLKENNHFREFKLLTYCIMRNHAHILIYTEDIFSMSKVMQKINTKYAKSYNEKENRVGYVFRDRYYTQPILDKEHLFNCITYIHYNPIKANIVQDLQSYKYSSYKDYVYKNGVVDNLTLELTYGKEYKDLFNILHKRCEVEDVEDIDIEYENYEDVIREYLTNKRVTILELIQDKYMVKELVRALKIRTNISARKIAKILDLSKDKINRILKDK